MECLKCQSKCSSSTVKCFHGEITIVNQNTALIKTEHGSGQPKHNIKKDDSVTTTQDAVMKLSVCVAETKVKAEFKDFSFFQACFPQSLTFTGNFPDRCFWFVWEILLSDLRHVKMVMGRCCSDGLLLTLLLLGDFSFFQAWVPQSLKFTGNFPDRFFWVCLGDSPLGLEARQDVQGPVRLLSRPSALWRALSR